MIGGLLRWFWSGRRTSSGTPVADAYLTDFISVPPVGRFVTVRAVSRFVSVPAIGRFVKVPRR